MRAKINTDSTKDIVLTVQTFEKAKGWKLYWELLKWVFTGMFMGTSDAVPGYSGGTTLALLGFFKRLILISKSVFVPEPGITRLKALTFMIPFAIGWMVGVFGFAKLTEFMVHHGCGLELIFFFAFFIAFAIPVFLRSEQPHLLNKDKNVKWRWIIFAIGLIVVLAVSLWTFIGHHGAPWGASKDTKSTDNKFDYNHNWWKLVIVAYLAGIITITPGGSGAIVQLLSGMYENIHWKIMAHPLDNIAGLATFAICTFLGMITAVFAFSWIIKHRSTDLAALSFGMLIASIAAVFLVPERAVWNELHTWKHIVGVCVASALAISVGLTINYVVRRKSKK